MTRFFRADDAARALVIVLVSVVACFGQDASKMEQVVQEQLPGNRFMGTVLVARGEKILLNKGYGHANLELEVANTPATKFRIGSITKQFTAAAILQLRDEGRLGLDDEIAKWLPDLETRGGKVTLRISSATPPASPNSAPCRSFARCS
jgi:CubicO group peptidase (beta-lactamase class C family)